MSGDEDPQTVTFGGSNIQYNVDIDAPAEIELGEAIDVTVTLTGLDTVHFDYAWLELSVNGKRLGESVPPNFLGRLDIRNTDWGPYIEILDTGGLDSASHTFSVDTTEDRFYSRTESAWESPAWGSDDTISVASRRFRIVTGSENEDGIRSIWNEWQNANTATADVELQFGRRAERHVDDVKREAMDALGEHSDFSRTSWQQLKPVPRDDLTEGTRAEVYDPLWLLGRQWQVGEFDGEDAGSPVRTELFYDTDELNEYDPAPDDPSVEPRSYELSDGPLEAMVEREPVATDDDGPGLEVAAEAGQYFLRLLDEHDYTVPDGEGGQRPPHAEDFPGHQLTRPDEPLDAAARRYTMVVDGRGVDGTAIYEAAVTQGTDAPCPTASNAAAAGSAYRSALSAFTDWYADLYDEPSDDEPSPWTPDRMEYQFGVATGEGDTRTEFKAGDYAGGRLDWYAFEVDQRARRQFDIEGAGSQDGLTDVIAQMDAARNTVRAIGTAQGQDSASEDDWRAADSGTDGDSESDGRSESSTDDEQVLMDPSLIDQQVAGETLIETTADQGDRTSSGEESADDQQFVVDAAAERRAAEQTLADAFEQFDTTPGNRRLAGTIPDADVTPTKASYPGMPEPRYWAFEDGEVNLKQMKAGPGELGKTLMLEFATLYGNDWYQLDIDVPLGSLARVTGMTVTDTFGEVTAVPPTGKQTDEWGMFTFDDLPNHDEPGLFVPPVLSTHEESDPVEEVVFTRDEMANLAFAIETTIEDPIGDPLERVEFALPAFELDAIEPSPDPTAEYLAFQNPGEDIVDVSEWTVAAELAVTYTTQSGTKSTTERRIVFEFPSRNDADSKSEVELEPDDTFRLYTADPKGSVDPAVDARAEHAGESAPVWNRHHSDDISITRGGTTFEGEQIEQVAISVIVEDADGNPTTVQPLSTPVDPSLSDYRLATDMDDYWFPMKPIIYTGDDDWRAFEPSVDLVEEFKDLWRFDVLDMRFRLAQLVDADVATLPVPLGEILDVDDGNLELYDEELTRAGLAVRRSYQRTRWVDGNTHLWSGRRVETGFGELASDLQYDVLEAGALPDVEGVE